MHHFAIELVVVQFVFAREKFELFCWDEREYVSCFHANGAIAGNRSFEVHGGFETHGAAMAATSIGLGFSEVGHDKSPGFVVVEGGSSHRYDGSASLF